MLLFGDVTLNGWTMGSVYWGITPFNNYDVEAWVVIGPTAGDGDDTLIGQLDEDYWTVNWQFENFNYVFPAPAGPFRIGFRYVGSDGAQAGLDQITVDGTAAAPANDCNANGVPDECDISIDFGGYCDPMMGPCSTDYDGNGVPDECELCGDFDADLDVDIDDYWTFMAATGTCVGDAMFNALCDLDGDDCITIVDYQMWVECYRLANGKNFVPPIGTEVTKPQPVPGGRGGRVNVRP